MTISALTSLSRKSCWAFFSESKMRPSSPAFSVMPRIVVSALHAPAIVAAKRTAFSAGWDASLQIKIFITEFLACKFASPRKLPWCARRPGASFHVLAGEQTVNDNRRADQRQRHERQANLRPAKILRRRGADLRADGRSRVH